MTDNEIKKAFNDALILDSMNIELWHDKEDKPILLPLKEVAELINHLQESKEYYKKSRDKCQDNVMYLSKECDEWQEKCDRLQAEIERLKNHLAMSKKEIKRCVTHYKMACTERNEFLEQLETAKTEAYKEFAERLHCECQSVINQPWNKTIYPDSWTTAYEEFDKKVDNLLKEKVGDK